MLSGLESLLLLSSFFCLMIGIGASLEKEDVLLTLQAKKPLYYGLCLQYLLLPSLACGLALGLGLSPWAAGTLLLIAACPGGSTSNMFTYFARANLSLSLFLTFLTTLNAFWMTPLLVWAFSSQLPFEASVSIPLPNLIMTLVAALLPVILGFVLRLKSVYWAQRVEKWGSRIGYFSMLAMVFLWYPKMKLYFLTEDPTVFWSTGLLSFAGILGAYWISRIFGFSQIVARTLSFETGIQNAPWLLRLSASIYPKSWPKLWAGSRWFMARYLLAMLPYSHWPTGYRIAISPQRRQIEHLRSVRTAPLNQAVFIRFRSKILYTN